MSETPERCPTCNTAVPEGAKRCPGCGRVFGEANRCPHCHAIAAVRRVGDKTVCAACGKPRVGTVVLGSDADDGAAMVPASREGREASREAMMLRARGRTQRGFGIVSVAGGVLMAVAMAVLFSGALGLGLAAAAALIAVGLGALSVRAGARNMQKAVAEDARARELAVLELAEKEGGVLTATQVAQAFGMTAKEADAMLTEMVGDGSRISVDVDEEGVLTYVFRELRRSVPKVRVAPDDEPALAEAELEDREEAPGARRESGD